MRTAADANAFAVVPPGKRRYDDGMLIDVDVFDWTSVSFYELCALAELRDRLRAGDIWVTGSRQYRDFETYLIPAATFETMRQQPLPLDIDTHLPSYMAEYRHKLEDSLTTVARKARENTLPDVTLTDGHLRIAPLRKNTPESAEVFAENAYALMPHVKITELLAEVDQWTNLGDQFLHLRTQVPPKNRQALLTAVLADGINLGLTRMSEACRETTWRQLSWTADWHVREECYAQALAGLIDAQHRLPLVAHWGSGTTSSSDAQFFRAGGRGEVGGTREPALWSGPRRQVLHSPIRSVWSLSFQGDCRDGQRGTPRARWTGLSQEQSGH
jgi:Tn3 transposase DDE domain